MASADPVDLGGILTLLLLVLHAGTYWYVQVPITILALTGFALGRLRREPTFWFTAFVVVSLANAINWEATDNHKYLIAYWCLALSLSLRSAEPARVLIANARMLIGLTFLMAVFWKAMSPDYLNGSFFHFALLFDDRFAYFARLFGGQIPPFEQMNEAAQRAMLSYDSTLDAVQLRFSTGVAPLAGFLTWSGFLIECAVAACFLLPARFGLQRGRDAALILFLCTAYSIASVVGFGWILALMGCVQALPRRRTAWAYVACIALIQVFRVPWRLLLPFAGPTP